jgi:stringent starvation protein B
MSLPLAPDSQGTSTRPYLIRALHDWCTDNGFTPYLAVHVDATVQVPMEHVKNNEIVLNVGFEATSGLKLGNEFVEFAARFGGLARNIVVPVDHVVAIYARENGQGMAFPVPTEASTAAASKSPAAPLRGLRLASVDGSAEESAPGGALPTKGHRAQPLLPMGPQDSHDSPESPEPPEPPAAPNSPRPSLKRIK